MNFEITTKKFEDMPVMYVYRRVTNETFGEIGNAFDTAVSYVMQNKGEIMGSFLMYDECTMEFMDIEACVAVKYLLPENQEVKAKVVDGGEFLVARAIHEGSYEGLHACYQELMPWIEEQGYVQNEIPMREIYLNSPMMVSEEELLTEIIIPVEKV